MKIKSLILLAAVAGIVCGYISSHWLLIGWGNIIFWAVVGVLLGLFASDRRAAIWGGVTYGYLMSLSFLLTGFGGTSDKLPSFIIFSLALSLVGAMGGIISLTIGWWLKKWLRLTILFSFIILAGLNFWRLDMVSHSGSDTLRPWLIQTVILALIFWLLFRWQRHRL